MAGHDDGESFFDDDDLDALPDAALVELENNAIQFTQAQTQARLKGPLSSDYGDDFEDEDLDDAVVIDESRSTPVIAQSFTHRYSAGLPAQREQSRHQRYGNVSNPHVRQLSRPQLNDSGFHEPIRISSHPPQPNRHAQVQDSRNVQEGNLPTDNNEERQRLEQELEEQRRVIKRLQEELNAKGGEISIVRSKHDKEVKEHERELAALRKRYDDQVSQQMKALEAARTAERNAAVERDFLMQDLKEETGKNRQLAKEKGVQKTGGPVTTPKKQKAPPHRDGFDDDEIEIISPSKVSPLKFQKRLVGSPVRQGKRKRKVAESPAGQLEIQVEAQSDGGSETRSNTVDEALLAKLAIQDDRYDFLGTVLDHRFDAKHLRTLEELGKYALPSAPRESFQSIILGKIPALGFKKFSISTDFCQMLISMWKNCIDEKYYKPTYLFIDILTFILELKTPSIAPQIIESLVPVAMLTAELVFVPRFKKFPVPDHINGTACMNLLYLAALECMSAPEHITLYWKTVNIYFLQSVLSVNQIRADFELMLRLLSTSVMKDSFGCIHHEPYPAQTRHILDRLTYFITETPVLPFTDEKLDAGILFTERYQILQLLVTMTRSPYAGREIAIHPLMIGGYLCLLSDALDDLYDFKGNGEEIARFINLATRFLYHMVTNYSGVLDLQKKLAAVHGGSQKYLLCLSRLAYIETDLVLESGIDPDVSALAAEMLNDRITPEEGEAIDAAFHCS